MAVLEASNIRVYYAERGLQVSGMASADESLTRRWWQKLQSASEKRLRGLRRRDASGWRRSLHLSPIPRSLTVSVSVSARHPEQFPEH